MISISKTGAAFACIPIALAAAIFVSTKTKTVEDYSYQPAVGETVLKQSDSGRTVIMVGSYTCSHCKDFYEGTFQEIIRKVDATVVYRHVWPTSLIQRSAALLTACSPRERQDDVITSFFKDQKTLIRATDISVLFDLADIPPASRDDTRACAEKIDGDMLRDQERDKKRFDIQGTPTIVVDGTVYTGNRPFEDLGFHDK